ncbi:hypothetical protein [Brachybacterium sacelli]
MSRGAQRLHFRRRRNDQNLWMALGGVACKARTFPRMIYKERSL